MPGESIKYFREKRGISQREMAKKLEINRSLLSGIETNKVQPTFELLRKIAQILECYVYELDRTIK